MAPVKVGILSPTTWQLVEKMAALFPEGVEAVGPVGSVAANTLTFFFPDGS